MVTERMDETEARIWTEQCVSLLNVEPFVDREEMSPDALAAESESENEVVIQSESECTTLCVGAVGAESTECCPLDSVF